MKVFKLRRMMQEHRQFIKRASAEAGTAGQANTHFENTLGMLCKVFNKSIYDGALVYCNGP
jgi:hypothetical protein